MCFFLFSLEILIQDYSSAFEITKTFLLPNGFSVFEYNAICYVKDNYEGITQVTAPFTIYESSKTSGLKINDLLFSVDYESTTLSPAELTTRARIVKSLVEPDPSVKSIAWIAKVEYTSKANTSSLVLSKPPLDNTFCSNQGRAILIDKNLICECSFGFTGINCNIDVASTLQIDQAISSIYSKLVNNAYIENYNYIIEGVDNLLSAAAASTDNNTIFLNSIEFMKVSEIQDPYGILNNYNSYLGFLGNGMLWGANK